MCYDSICMVERVQRVSLNVMHHSENPIKWCDCSASSVLFRLRSIPFWKLKLALKGRRFGDSSTIQEQSAVRTVQKMVDIFIRDGALKECPLCWSQCGWCSTTSIETSVYDVSYLHLECNWTWWPYKERSLIMWDHLKLYFSCQNTCSRTHCYVDGQPLAVNQNQGTLPCGKQRSSTFEGCSSGSFITPYGWTFWQGLSCNGWRTA